MNSETPDHLDAKSARRLALRDVVPWSSPMTTLDKVLIICIAAGVIIVLGSLPLRPLLIADHPVALSAITGGLPTIGAAAAFARIGEADLWLVIAAGIFGLVKLDWLFWLAGRTWGPKAVAFFAPGRRAERFMTRLERLPRGVVGLLVVLAFLPGIPKIVVHLFAGLSGMRLRTFLCFDILGAALITGAVVTTGYALGQDAVDLIILIDEYALWVTLGILAVAGYLAGSTARKNRSASANGHVDASDDTAERI